MKYKFRLTLFHKKPGFFHINKNSETYRITDDLLLEIYPRDSDTLLAASKYHIDCGGFNSEKEAYEKGEKVRQHLRLLNCIFNLGISIPNSDSQSGQVSDSIRQKAREDGIEVMNTIVGLRVFPDNDSHLEIVSAGDLKVYPSEPLFVLKALRNTWPYALKLEENTLNVIEILNISIRETSPKVRFLTTYLAIEQIILKDKRGEDAQKLISELIDKVKKSDLKDSEKKSLKGALSSLTEHSFSSAFKAFSYRVKSPKTISGESVPEFVSKCIEIRNKIAHKAIIDKNAELEKYTTNLRRMVLGLIWSQNNLPNISLQRPADKISIDKMEIKLM